MSRPSQSDRGQGLSLLLEFAVILAGIAVFCYVYMLPEPKPLPPCGHQQYHKKLSGCYTEVKPEPIQPQRSYP